MTTINRVIHKKLYENKDQRHVEDLNGQKVGNVLTKKSSNTPTMAELTRNLSPSLVEFARKHLSPSVADFTRKHDPDMDAEPADHMSDLVSYESWGSNREPDNFTSTMADKNCSEKKTQVSSTEKIGEIKPASPSTSSSSSNLKHVPASAFVPKKGSLVSKTFLDKTKTISADVSDLARDVSPQSTAALSSGYSSDVSDSSTVRTVNFVPRKDSPRTVGSDVTDKVQKKSKTPPSTSRNSLTETGSSELNKAPDYNKVKKYVDENSTSKVSATPPPESRTSSLSKTSESASPLSSTKLSETSSSVRSPTTLSSSQSATKSTETASSLLASTRSTETVSSAFSSTKSSETASSVSSSTRLEESASSLSSTKISENKTQSSVTASGGGPVIFSPIRLPDGNKVETVSKTLVPESAKTSQVGAIRSDNQTSRKERKAQTHPYTRRHRRDSWSFDIPYRNLQELMRDLTTDTFKQKNVNVSKPQKSKGHIPRFRNYRFKRSSIPDCLPDSPDDSDEFTAEAIPDFEERKRKADILECMQATKKEDQEDYTAEQCSYSPGATSAPKPKPGDDKGKGEEKEKIHERLLRISKMTSPAAQAKDKSSVDKETMSKGSSKDKTMLGNIQSESDSSNNNRKRRISQTCSPSRKRDWRQSRSRHNTGLGETSHSQPIEEDTSSGCRSKDSTPSDVKGGKSSLKSSRESTPFDSSLLRQGSREYSPSEFFCGTGEGESSRENTPTDFTQDVDISKMSQFDICVPKVGETQKRKFKIKRLDNNTERVSSSSPGLVRSDDCNNPHMFRPIPTHKPTDGNEKDDLKDNIQQLEKEKENKFESDSVKASNGLCCSETLVLVKESRSEKPAQGSNEIGCPNNERITVGQKTYEENVTDGESRNNKDGNISDEDMSDWIVMDEFHCQEVSVLKELVSHDDGDLENKPDDPENKTIRNFAEKPITNSAENDKNVKRNVSVCLPQSHYETPPTGTKENESYSDDQLQNLKNKESVTNSAVEDTDDAVSKSLTRVPSTDGIKEKDLPTESEKCSDFYVTDSLCSQTRTYTNEESGLETNHGDKTIIENSDMSISEIGNDHQFADASQFVPVIYLSGTKGRKIPWAKELDQAVVTEETVGTNSKTDIQSSMKTDNQSNAKEEICVSVELDKSKLMSEEVQGFINTHQLGTKEENTSSSDLNRTNNNSSSSLSALKLKKEDDLISNHTSASSSRELTMQTSEGIGILRCQFSL
ncbi:uncharacterized protein LOC117331853 [Pecten maximus]|uniref:uncharacterized protein LOC117331853 n=1 Tax=Pecten maximus TaxID=6579 RepID=UPI001458FE23|nr:uncharacterized protein LOC117331853 [Pecten maximus]